MSVSKECADEECRLYKDSVLFSLFDVFFTLINKFALGLNLLNSLIAIVNTKGGF